VDLHVGYRSVDGVDSRGLLASRAEVDPSLVRRIRLTDQLRRPNTRLKLTARVD
jgi:hypothetical protein